MSSSFAYPGSLIICHDSDWHGRQRNAGKCVAQILKRAKGGLESEKYATVADLLADVAPFFSAFDCTPTFLGYKGFPGIICLSINKELVHGIPKSEYQFQPGDVVKVDLGATYQGAIADAALTCIYGGYEKAKQKQHVELITACRQALHHGIGAIKVGNQLGCIGNAISHTAKKTRFSLVVNYGGHGLDEDRPHAEPFVLNRANKNEGVRLQPGMSLAIEPMLIIGDNRTRVMDDGWTVMADGICAHEEHTIYVCSDGSVEVMTEW